MKTNRIAAILLLVTLGYFGVHSFYQKKTTAGVLYILAFTVGLFLVIPPLLASIFLLVELYKLLTTTDADYAKMQEDAYEDTEKSGLTAGALGLIGGLFGLHFSYLGLVKAARNRFLMFIIPSPFFTALYMFFTFAPVYNNGVNLDTSNVTNSFLTITGVFFLLGIYYLVIYILSLIESYKYLQQKIVVSE